MIWPRNFVKRSTETIGKAVSTTLKEYRDGYVEQEPPFTDRLLARITDEINKFETEGIRWKAKTFTDRGPKTQENQCGADFAGVFDASIKGQIVSKYFLVQVKRLPHGGRLPTQELKRLENQCDKMLRYTSDSFVFCFSQRRAFIVPAIAVMDSPTDKMADHQSKTVQEFFKDHFNCFIGERILTPNVLSPNGIALFNLLVKERIAKNILFLSVHDHAD